MGQSNQLIERTAHRAIISDVSMVLQAAKGRDGTWRGQYVLGNAETLTASLAAYETHRWSRIEDSKAYWLRMKK
jgi:hypothetical protein